MLSRFSQKSKRIIFLIAIAVCAIFLTGCGATLTVYDYTADGVHYNMYELNIDAVTAANMEASAITAPDGKKYTVASYFYDFFDDYGYELVSAHTTDKGYTASYRKALYGVGELFEYGTPVEFKYTYTQNLFYRTTDALSENPFNGVREAYDNVSEMQSVTPIERLKNGSVAFDENGDVVIGRHALTEAFPYLKTLNTDGMLLNYVRYGSARMDSSGTVIASRDNTAAYLFSRYFDRTDAKIEFMYKNAVPYGWYIVAITGGGIALGVILLITRQKKQKPSLLDKFPYNPEEYRDYDSHLPMSK